jgi:hypothetical protein
MNKILNHRKRYRVEYDNRGWYTHRYYRRAWMARRVARYREGLGVFDYRVVDTWGES